MVVTNRGDGGWRSPGKRYLLKERWRTQWGGYGKQYGTGGERKSNQTYKADRTQTQGRNTAYESKRQGSYIPAKSTGNGQGGNEDRKDKKKYRDTKIGIENDSHEESDTEDSYEYGDNTSTIESGDPRWGHIKDKIIKEETP